MTYNEQLQSLMEEAGGSLSDKYYAYGQAQGGAAWHAVAMARAEREDG